MAAAPQPGQEYEDAFGPIPEGFDANTPPQLLRKTQLSFATNVTLRNGFPTDRSPYYFRAKVNSPGLWQYGCYYKPDTGNECLIASIAGRLFQFSVSGNVITETEITIPGDPNPATPIQAWLWQTENYVIVNDGQSIPIIYDGMTSRRSVPVSVVLGITSANFTVPAQGSTVNVTLSAPGFTGMIGQSVLINAATYQVVQTPGTAQADVTNETDIAGTNYPIGTPIYSLGNYAGTTTQVSGFNIVSPGCIPAGFFANLPYTLSAPFPGSVGDIVRIQSDLWRVVFVGTNSFKATNVNQICFPHNEYPIGTIVYFNTSTPSVVVGTLAAAFTAPTTGQTSAVSLVTDYTGPDNQAVFIGTAQYTIKAIPPPIPGVNITLKNINDTPDTVAIPHSVTAPANLMSVPELPAGRMATYGLGRNWICLTDGRSFIGGDIVGGPSGSAQFNYRDAVLKVTENTYLAGGGVFVVPGSVGNISFMQFAATLDSSLGQGALQVGTPAITFSCNAPVDRTTWQTLTNPILTQSLITNGGLGQYSTVQANGDLMFRAIDGIRSLVLARREFNTWGNVPQSTELNPILNADNRLLLPLTSAVIFDNRHLMTTKGIQANRGTYWTGLTALNFDPISSLRGKAPSIYDGLWTGLNVLQIIHGLFAGADRCFAFCLNTATADIEIHEIMDSSDSTHLDNGTDRIFWSIQSATLFQGIKGKDQFDFVQLVDGELYAEEILNVVDFTVYWRPDYDQVWRLWHSWSVGTQGQTTYMPRMGFGEPDGKLCDSITGRSARNFYTCQLRVDVQGHCRIMGVKLKAVKSPDTKYAKPICST